MDISKLLPFDSWNTTNFESIANGSGGLLQVDRNTEMFSTLTEAKIEVKSIDISIIPHSISLNINSINIPIYLIPIFIAEEAPQTANFQKLASEFQFRNTKTSQNYPRLLVRRRVQDLGQFPSFI